MLRSLISSFVLLSAPALFIAGAAAATSACGGSQTPAPTSNKMTIVIQSDEETNDGRPLHVLVRTVDLQAFLEEPYASVADKVITPDDTVVVASVIFPGTEERLFFDKPQGTPVAIYFLFTNPGTPWKMQVDEPLPRRIDLTLDKDRIVDSE